jgi:hypothetical protein
MKSASASSSSNSNAPVGYQPTPLQKQRRTEPLKTLVRGVLKVKDFEEVLCVVGLHPARVYVGAPYGFAQKDREAAVRLTLFRRARNYNVPYGICFRHLTEQQRIELEVPPAEVDWRDPEYV